jgi:hypothetical protein
VRLVNFGAGEITDRLTILALKLLHGRAVGKPVDHFARERDVLLAQIRARTLNGRWFEAVLALAAVNASLWQAEDTLRGYRLEPNENVRSRDPLTYYADVGRLAFRIQDLNDQRAELVALINSATGEHDGEEKI